MQIDTNYTCLLLRNKLGQTGQSLYLWLLVPSFLSRLPNFPSKGFFYFLWCCCYILSKLSPPNNFESTSSSKHSSSSSLSGKKNFFSNLQLSYILNSPSTECSSLSHLIFHQQNIQQKSLHYLFYII